MGSTLYRDTDAAGTEGDSHLLALTRRGDAAAFARFYDRHSPVAYGLALCLLEDEGCAAAVLEDVFLAVWTQAEPSAPPGESVRGWLLALICRCASARMRQAPSYSHHQAMLRDTSSPTAGAATGGQDPLSAAGPRLRAALRRLPADEREAILLAYFGGQTHEQIARHSGVPVATVDVWLLRGLQAVQASLLPPSRGAAPPAGRVQPQT